MEHNVGAMDANWLPSSLRKSSFQTMMQFSCHEKASSLIYLKQPNSSMHKSEIVDNQSKCVDATSKHS